MRQKTTPLFLFILILLTLAVTGCIRYTDRPSVPRPETAVTATSFVSNGYEVTRIHFDGHRYIEFKRTAGKSIAEVSPSVIHDPDCPCGLNDTDTENNRHTTRALDPTSYQRRLNRIQNLLAPTYVNLKRLPDANATGH